MPMRLLSNRLISHLSVRGRIISIALIPVVGFIVTGVNFAVGDHAVESTFQQTRRAAALSEASREFKVAVSGMQIAAKDFLAAPSEDRVKQFELAKIDTLNLLDNVQSLIGIANTQSVSLLRSDIVKLDEKFSELVNQQRRLGFDDASGLHAALQLAANTVERIINDQQMAWLPPAQAGELMRSLLMMRRFESSYRLTQREFYRQPFFAEHEKFLNALSRLPGPSELKAALDKQVRQYGDTFSDWIEAEGDIYPIRATIDMDSRHLLPEADKVIGLARRNGIMAEQELSASRQRTERMNTIVSLAVIALGLGFSWLIGRSITTTLDNLATAMKRLADGQMGEKIPATRLRDEIGAMARTVLVFRDRMIEREKLAENQVQLSHAREQRAETITATIAQFERSVDQALARLRNAASRLEDASADLNGAADTVSNEAHSAEQSAADASGNIATAASSVEELAASINEIAAQASSSTVVARRAVTESQHTASTMGELANAATRIGEVIGLIQAIAAQTNLLALNATIEAARAGQVGKGFAVVASEVKTLAGQTARATEEIASQVGAIQSATADATQAIEQMHGIIADMSTLATAVAATVDQQNSAVTVIAQGVSRAADEARTGAQAMSRVAGASTDARATAADVRAMADALAVDAENLQQEVLGFLKNVRAA